MSTDAVAGPPPGARIADLAEALRRTDAFQLEDCARRIDYSLFAFQRNADELQGALEAFEREELHHLMFVANREQLMVFLLDTTRRLYNYLATSVSAPHHVRAALRRIPASLSHTQSLCLAALDEFMSSTQFAAHECLRDYSIHHELPATSANLTFSPETGVDRRIVIDLTPVRAIAAGARRRGKRPPSPLARFGEDLRLLEFVVDFRAQLGACIERLQGILDTERQLHDAAAEAIRTEMRVLLNTPARNTLRIQLP